MNFKLCSQDDIVSTVARFSRNSAPMSLRVNESVVFGEHWLNLGNLQVFHPSPEPHEDLEELSKQAIQRGYFLWKLPIEKDVKSELDRLPVPKNYKNKNEYSPKLLKSIEIGLQDITRRLLLLLPVFDPLQIQQMPFHRPVSIVADTSSVLQGGIDFVAKFLSPMARIKVPTVVALEVLNMCDRFLKMYHGKHNDPRTLMEHLNSQGAQRTLLRLEWLSDVEIERPNPAQDPLRIVFQPDTKIKNLNLDRIQRSFADRLIFETAKEHRFRASAGHNVRLITSDQGLARMSLAEGLEPCFFESRSRPKPFGRTLSGSNLCPFKGTPYSVPLASLLWELAVSFGSVRLEASSGDLLEVAAIGKDLSWTPFNSKEDLLWCKWSNVPSSIFLEDHSHQPIQVPLLPPKKKCLNRSKEPTFYSFNPNQLLRTIQKILDTGSTSIDEVKDVLNVKSNGSVNGYLSFLKSANLILSKSSEIEGTDALLNLWSALVVNNQKALKFLFNTIPSFTKFISLVKKEKPNHFPTFENMPVRKNVLNGYRTLAEAIGEILFVPGIGICHTPYVPTCIEFSMLAVKCYKALVRSNPLVLTGSWLETLSVEHGIHPLHSRNLLEKAYQAKLIHRFFEGSTPETQFEKHSFTELKMENGNPCFRKVFLYHGDFLLDDRASVSLTIERAS